MLAAGGDTGFLYDTLGGCARILGAYAVAIVMTELFRSKKYPVNAWADSSMSALVLSLFDVAGDCDVAGKGTKLEQRAAALARQNQDAQAETVNSFAWSQIAAF